jgi:4,5-dihydroxyphthalate decarboxylase
LLESEYGIRPDEITWLTQEDSHVAQLGPQPTEQSLAPDIQLYDALKDGIADAAITLHLGSHADIRTVIADAEQVMRDWFSRHQAQPINHLLAVKTELLRKHDWLAGELTALFARARCRNGGADPAPWSANGAALLLEFCAKQGLTPTAYAPAQLVAGG